MSSLGRRQFHFGVGERWALTSALSYGVANVLIRAAAAHIDPWLGSLLRLLPTFFLAWFMLAHSGFPELRPGNAKYIGGRFITGLVIGGAASYVIGNVCFFLAITNGGLGISVNAVQGGSVWAGIILSLLVLRERARREQLLGAVAIAIGLTAIGWSQLGTPGQAWFLGLLFAVGAGVTYAVSNIFTRLVQRRQAALFASLACSAAGGFVPLFTIAIGRGILDPAGMLTGLRAYDVAVILLAGLVNIVALVGITQAVRHTSVATVNSIGSGAVVFSFLASIVIFGENTPLLMVLGVVAVVGGILLGQMGRREPARQTAEPAPETEIMVLVEDEESTGSPS